MRCHRVLSVYVDGPCLQVFKIQTYDHYGDVQLLNHLSNVLKMESAMSAESLGPDVDNVNQRWNQLVTGIADREVQYVKLIIIIITTKTK